MRFRFIEEHRETFEVGVLCRALEVSRSGYYAWKSRPASDRERENVELLDKIESLDREGDDEG